MAETTPQYVSLDIGAQAPDFDLPAARGGRVALRDLDERDAFVYVQGCNHCPYVHAYLERLTDLARSYEPRGVRFVMVNSNDADRYEDDSFEAMQAFAREHDLPFPYLHDEDQSVARAYRTVRTPEVLLFDRDRRLRYHGRIDDAPKDPDAATTHEFRDAIEAVLAGRDIAEPETWAVGCTVKWKPGRSPHG
ncbi:MAG: thioredoxin family protein [Trueperaceae bacterium]|nr:thioredoxin family protein [Trueperaceae bacterium]